MEEYGFYAMLDRMQYINRWALMRNSRYENIKEHSFDVAVIAHSLCLLHNRFNEGKEGAILPDPYKVMAYGINYGPEPDTIAYFIRSGARVEEVPIRMRERTAGR